MTVRVEVTVREDGREIAAFDVRYYRGQPFWVSLETPDGQDGRTPNFLAGSDPGPEVTPQSLNAHNE